MGATNAIFGTKGARNDGMTQMGWNCIGVVEGNEMLESLCPGFDDILDRDTRNWHPLEPIKKSFVSNCISP